MPPVRQFGTPNEGQYGFGPGVSRSTLKPLQRFLCNSCGRSSTCGRWTARRGWPLRRLGCSRGGKDLCPGTNLISILATLSSSDWDARHPAIASTAGFMNSGPQPSYLWRYRLNSALAGARLPFRRHPDSASPAASTAFLVGVDHHTRDIVHALVLPEQAGDAYARLVPRLGSTGDIRSLAWSPISHLAFYRHTRTVFPPSPSRPVGCTSTVGWTMTSPSGSEHLAPP